MASNNIILAVPSANSSVNYELPQSESAKLSFSPEDIDGIKLDGSGGLVISFVEGGQVTLTNFQSFIDNGNTLSLADGTNVDPKLLFNALGGEQVAANDDSIADAIKIDVPSANAQQDVTLEPGKKYLLNFDLSETSGAEVKDGQMVIGFANGGKITITNYEEVMAGKMPPELSLASKTCVVTGDELITNIQKLAATDVVEPTEEKEQEAKSKSKIAAADMDGQDAIGPGDATEEKYKAEHTKAEGDDAQKVANVEPAAGDEADIAKQLAQIETAAGPGAGAGRAGGYGYGSRFAPDPFNTNPDIGPIDPTQLRYRAPILEPSKFLIDNDDNPLAIAPGAKFVDETNLENGPLTVSGSISINYGADGPGGVSPNNTFSSGGSQTGGQLSSHGDLITVTIDGNKYVGTTSGGVVVFELSVDPQNGDYTYTQFEAIDHANGTDPNDQILLNFGVTAKDGDGDSVNTTIQIVVADDAPEISGDEETVDETNLGPIVLTDTLVHDFNEDGPGHIEVTGTFSSSGSQLNGTLSSSGVPVTVTSTANGYEGKANGVVVFTLTINPATGEYTYTQFKNLDHADASNPDDIITLNFGAKIVDYDGDSATAPIIIHVKDDAPIFQPPCEDGCEPGNGGPTPDKGLEIVDETALKGGAVVETGKLDANFGSDVPGSYAFKADSFTSSGSKTNGALTHNGVPVVVSLVNGEWVGKAGDLTVFKLELNTTTGDYKFTLYDNLDHADKSNPDDQIVLDFGVAASDFDGDSADGSIRIIVKDDGPVANDDINTYDTTFGVANGNVISGLNGGPGAADVLSTDAFATGPENKVIKIAFGGNEVDVPATGSVSIDGQYGTLTISADGTYTYKAFDDAGMINHGGEKEFVSGPALPDFDESEALDGVEQQSLGVAPGNLSLNGGETVTVKFHSEQAGYGNTMGVFTVGPDGKLKAETVLIKDGNAATAGQTYTYAAGSDATSLGFFIVANGANVNNGYPGVDFSKGSLNFVYDYGLPTQRDALATDDGSHIKLVYTSEGGTQTVLNGPLYFTTDRGGSENLNADDSVRVVSGVPGSDDHVLRIGFEDLPNLGDKDFNDMVFDISITGQTCGCGNPDIKDQFTYTLQDSDGDIDKATLTLNGQDLTDDQPILTAPAAETVDETNLNNGALSESGNILVDFGHDGPGTLAASGAFTSTGSKTNGALTHNGVPVVVSLVGDTYVGKAGSLTVFTMQIKADGTYTFKQFDNLDHADKSNPDDVITLNFGVKATDCDGDVATTNVVVHVKDDGPVAHNDVNSYDTNAGTASGNVVTGLNGGAGAADVLSTDANNTVTKVSFGGHSVTVPATGEATIDGQYGTLHIKADGTYTYEAFHTGGSATAVEKHFVDGPALPDFDEREPLDNVERESLGVAPGNLSVDAGDQVTVSFVSTNGAFNDNTLGVFTIAPDGTLKAETILIASGSSAVSGQNFSYTAGADAVATGFFLLQDGNDINNDYSGLDFSKGTLNFVYDYGLPTEREAKATDDGSHIKLVYTSEGGVDTVLQGNAYFTTDRGSTDNLNADDSIRVVSGIPNGDDTTLRISFEDANNLGDKDYNDMIFDIQIVDKDCGCNSSPQTDVFEYTLTDGDGDSDTATLTLTGKDLIDSNPIFTTPAPESVDETNLASGTITETGHFAVNFGADGPGTVAGNGTFTSGGSQLNGKLTSAGVAVQVTQVGDMYFGKANGVTVFTLQVKADGSYTFKQFEQLDHADGSNPNDEILLNFGVTATDCDGDTSQTTLTVKVADDAPDAKNDSNSATEGQTVTGNVLTNDVIGQDTPGTFTKINFGGKDYSVPTNGTSVVINGTYGTLTINNKGEYSYTAHSDNPNGTDVFTYTIKDRDGDTDTAKLTINVTSIDDCPVITPDIKTVDETNLSGGTITQTGHVNASYGTDGPGTVAANGSFSSSGSKLGGALTSGGQTVVVSLNGDTYEGKANGVTVFTLKVAANGDYTFKLFEQLDHADGSNPNDSIALQFGVKATDADGDVSSSTITVNVLDDAPDAKNDGNSVAESGTVTGNVTSNDVVGQDVPGKVTKVTIGNTSYDVPTDGSKIVISGQYGKLTIDNTGAYSYTANSNNPNGTDAFTYTLKDRDGDTDTACLSIQVSCQDDVPTITPAVNAVDETNLASGVITKTGSVSATYGSDGPGTIAGNGSFTSSGSKTGGNLTSNGKAVTVTLNGDTYTGKDSSGTTIFTLQIAANGAYTFKQFEQLDHANGSDPNDVINLQFGVKATDADGDVSSSTITIKVADDAPVAHDDHNTSTTSPATGNVITGLNGGPGAADTLSQDVTNKVVKVSFAGHEVDVPSTGTATIDGANGTLTIKADGSYTYTAHAGANSNGEEKTFVGGPTLPDFDESEALDGVEQQSLGIAKGNLSVGEGDVITVKFVGEQAGYSNTLGIFTVDASGKLKAETIVIPNSDTANNSAHTYTASAGAVSTGFFIIADGADLNNNYAGLDLAHGSLDFVYKYGTGSAREATINDSNDDITLVFTAANGTKTIIEGPTYFTSDRGDYANLNDGEVRVVSGLPDQSDNTVLRIGFEDLPCLGDKDYNDVVFDISITNPDCGCDNSDVFTYTLQDGDTDTSTATLTLDCIAPVDDKPTLTGATETLDETNLKSGILTETGSVTATYGADGPGTVTGNGTFSSGGSKLGGNLTSGGKPVTVTLNGDTYTGKDSSGTTIFTLKVATNGDYAFKLFEQLDHADGTKPNDSISLNFGVTATDADGDTASATITVNVLDDAPIANDDGRTTAENQTITGNVTNNDVVGQDVQGTVTKITYNGTTYDLTGGAKVINTANGTLTIDSTGGYSYTAKNNASGTDSFTYTLKDKDGDTDTACLTIDVSCTDDIPVITPDIKTIDETNLASGTITTTGAVTANYGADGPGAVTANGSFTSGGSKLGGALTSHGSPITVSLSGNTYTGKDAHGTTIFTLAVAANGSYSFKLFEQLDHADGTNPNDSIALNFGVTATDSDGDTASATITVNVKDDAPIANDDGRTMVNGTATITGNVTDNDVVGQDIEGKVTSISFNGTTKAINATGTTTIAGQYGTLEIDSTGHYVYTAKINAHGTDNFTYVLKDADGDTDPACLSIEVKENPIVVCIFADDICVKEDSNGNVPVHAYITGGSGNETMTITLTGVPAGWTVTSAGWTKSGGVYTLQLPQGVNDWQGSVNFKPPANSDADLTGLVFKASVYDPDTNATTFATEDVNITVDAVIDPLRFSAGLTENPSAPNSGKIFVMTQEKHVFSSKINISNITHPDNDGSESLKKIIFTIQDGMDNTTYISVKNPDGTYSKVGTQSASGKDTVYTIDLSGMTYNQAVDYITNKLYLTNTGHSGLNGDYNLGITLVSYEKNLSGAECDYTDNETSYTVCVPVEFCISPLVIDLDKDGVELLSKDHGVLFDMTNDGVKDQTGWTAKDDALLAFDKNHDGQINDRTELFGNSEDFADGFASLAVYDVNKDGIIDAKDAVFKDLVVWQDANSDGISQANEMKSLSDVGIAGIKLDAQSVEYDIAGNPVTHESQVLYADGSSSAIVDAWFTYNDGSAAGVDKGLTLQGTAGNDVIAGTAGNDDLYGGLGADTFLFQTINEGVDALKDFNVAEGDKIDLSNVLTNFDPVTDAINDFVFAKDTGDGHTILSVNTDGQGGEAAAHQFAVVDSGNINVTDLFNNGSIIV